jgi:hypothetical protein
MFFNELACFPPVGSRARRSTRRIFVEGISNVSYCAQCFSNVESSNVELADRSWRRTVTVATLAHTDWRA